MRYFLSGGSKSGKSMLAQRLARDMAGPNPLYYVATMVPQDAEDRARIRRHLQERAGWGFTTVECGAGLLEGLQGCDRNGSFLLDSVTALLSNEMFRKDGSVDLAAPERLAAELEQLCRMLPNLVAVSDYLYSDARCYDDLTQAYRRGLARLDRTLAKCCDGVFEVTAGCPVVWKGCLP